MASILGIPFTTGNKVRFLQNGDEIFPAMLDAIEGAKESIRLLTFVYWTGDIATAFAEALSDRARAGVDVTVLLDAYGAARMEAHVLQKMESAGVRVSWFRPLRNLALWKYDNRSHRKILVCDRRIAFTGGVGIAAEWEGDARNPDEWRDTHVELRGPAVQGIEGAFWDNWLEMNRLELPELPADLEASPSEHGVPVQVVRSSSNRYASDAATMIKAALHLARDRIRIATPYFTLDEPLLDMLLQQAREGVEIQIMIPGQHIDRRVSRWAAESSFEELLESDAEIRRYQKTMLHQKIILVDDFLSLVGSTNFNQRSLRKDEEIMLVFADHGVSRELHGRFDQDLLFTERVTAAHFFHRGFLQRAKEFVTRPFTEQL